MMNKYLIIFKVINFIIYFYINNSIYELIIVRKIVTNFFNWNVNNPKVLTTNTYIIKILEINKYNNDFDIISNLLVVMNIKFIKIIKISF